MRATFRQSERLKSRKQIGQLFKERHSVGAYPLRVFWNVVPATAEAPAIKVGFSVPKRQYKRAVHRNRLRRLMQESFRLNKALLYPVLTEHNIHLHMMLVYVGKEPSDFATVQRKYRKLCDKLIPALTDQLTP